MSNTADHNTKTNKKPNKSGLSRITYHFSWFLIFLLFVILSAAAGGYLGYRAALKSRMDEYSARLKETVDEQYKHALQDYEDGKYQNVKTRLEYINSVDNHPDAQALYDKVIAEEDSMIDSIRQAVASKDWTTAIKLYESLQEKDFEYRKSELEGQIYIAFRNYGVDLIRDGYLENGIKNIDFAGNIGPVDSEADELRTAASKYMSASGYWDIDWTRAMELFANIALTNPDLFDQASMLTAQQRYVRCTYEVAKEYINQGNYCAASAYYKQGLALIPDKSIQATADFVNMICYPTPTPTEIPTAEPYVVPTVDPTLEASGYYYYYYY